MIKSVISKIRNNIWMFVCLIVGSLLITGVLACIPMYTMGTLRQMLSTDLRSLERETGRPSGQLYFTGKISNNDIGLSRVKGLEKMKNTVVGGVDGTSVEIINYYVQNYVENLNSNRLDGGFSTYDDWAVSTLTNLESNIYITQGRMYSNSLSGDVIEVIIEESTWENSDNTLELGKVYSLVCSSGKKPTVKLMPVGVFKVNDENSPFWYNNSELFYFNTFCSANAFDKYFCQSSDMANVLTGSKIYLNLDFTNAGLENLSSFISYYNKVYTFSKELGTGRYSLTMNSLGKIRDYINQISTMQMSLWVLNVPVIAMLAFYMIMVTRMIIEEDRNEISTFKSRGAKTSQIFMRYVIESGFISVFALVLGPFLGFLLAKTVGNASGFLEFNARQAMPVKLDFLAFGYAIVACLFFSSLILIPAIMATKGTIVNLKQRRARKSRLAWWEKSCIDIICLVVSVGLLVLYEKTNGFNHDGTVAPIVYVLSSLFILGCGLLFLRIYPFIIALFFKLTKKILPPSGYAAFVQVSRGGNDYRFLMLFIIMTISVGIYSAASARMINNNVENTVRFENGADVILHPDFTDYAAYVKDSDGNVTFVPESYRVFPIEEYADNEYVKSVSRVEKCSDLYVFKSGRLMYPDDGRTINLMAIDPYEFGQIGWCGSTLNDRTFHEILNKLELEPMTVFISEAMAEEFKIKVGDVVEIDVNESNQYYYTRVGRIPCVVAGIINYWPTMQNGTYKVEKYTDENGEELERSVGGFFVIMNYEYLYSVRSFNEFDLYVAVEDSAKQGYDTFVDQAFNSGLINHESEIRLYGPDIMENEKSNSALKGLNGSYSIGFVSTLTVSFVGFLIYWLMNVRNRKLQFGILRAMGLTKNKLTVMLVIEHLLTTGVSVILGIVIGAVTVRVYAPLLKIAYTGSVLPLDILFNRSDNLKIYAVVLAMLISGIAVLSVFIRKLKINEAVKIGEE